MTISKLQIVTIIISAIIGLVIAVEIYEWIENYVAYQQALEVKEELEELIGHSVEFTVVEE